MLLNYYLLVDINWAVGFCRFSRGGRKLIYEVVPHPAYDRIWAITLCSFVHCNYSYNAIANFSEVNVSKVFILYCHKYKYSFEIENKIPYFIFNSIMFTIMNQNYQLNWHRNNIKDWGLQVLKKFWRFHLIEKT